jgi:chemotaxis methyl-accepting protein methylase
VEKRLSNSESVDLFKKFTGYLEKKFGWFVIPSKIENTAFILGKLIIKFGENNLVLLFGSAVNHDFFSEIDDEIIDLYSISETYFNREPETLHLLDSLTVKVLKNRDEISVLCAASSSGEEVYSVAIELQKYRSIGEVKLYGAEINTKMIKIAEEGVYSDWSLRSCSPDFKEKYFHKEGKKYKLKEEFKRGILFTRYNLLSSNISYYFKEQSFDIILCRNLFLYLNHNATEKVIYNLLKLLNPGGFIITGLAEGASSAMLKPYTYNGYQNIFRFEK